MLKEIGKTDSFDRMISALKHSVDQHLNQELFEIIWIWFGQDLSSSEGRMNKLLNIEQQQSRYDGGASGATQAGWDPQHQENIFN